MIPDHLHPNRAAPETYDRDWFLAQLNGRDPTAPRTADAPAQPAAVTAVVLTSSPALAAPDEVLAALDEVLPSLTRGSRARYAGVLAGAGVGVLLVASAAFAIGGMPVPMTDPPAQAQPDGAPTPSRTPEPQLTTLVLPGETVPPTGDTVRGRAASPRSDPRGQQPDPGDSSDPLSSPTPSGSSEPTTPPTPTPEPSIDDPSPSPTPSETTPSDPDPTPDPDPTSSGLCDLLPEPC